MWKTASCIEYNSLKTTYGHDRFELLLLILQPLKKNVGFFFSPSSLGTSYKDLKLPSLPNLLFSYVFFYFLKFVFFLTIY